MGLAASGELQLRRRGANDQSQTSFLSPIPLSKRDTRLTAYDDDTANWSKEQHSTSDDARSAPTKKKKTTLFRCVARNLSWGRRAYAGIWEQSFQPPEARGSGGGSLSDFYDFSTKITHFQAYLSLNFCF